MVKAERGRERCEREKGSGCEIKERVGKEKRWRIGVKKGERGIYKRIGSGGSEGGVRTLRQRCGDFVGYREEEPCRTSLPSTTFRRTSAKA